MLSNIEFWVFHLSPNSIKAITTIPFEIQIQDNLLFIITIQDDVLLVVQLDENVIQQFQPKICD